MKEIVLSPGEALALLFVLLIAAGIIWTMGAWTAAWWDRRGR